MCSYEYVQRIVLFYYPSLQNVSKALSALHDLKELQFSAADLEKVPDLVYTVRKVSGMIKKWFLRLRWHI